MDPGSQDGAHRHFEEMAVAHVLGGLDEHEGRVFRSHLLDCSDCRARVGELRSIAHDLADVERDERRVRAAKAIDTKRREATDEDGEGVAPPPTRGSRLMVVVVATLVLLLAAWNFTLRNENARLASALQERVLAMEVIELGREWPVEIGHGRGVATEKDGNLVVLVERLDDTASYSLWLRAANGTALERKSVQSREGRILTPPIDLPEGAAEVLVTDRPPTGLQPEGTTVFAARAALTADAAPGRGPSAGRAQAPVIGPSTTS